MNRFIPSKWQAFLACCVFVVPLAAGCGSGETRTGANLPPVDDSQTMPAGYPAQSQPAQKKGMSTGTKVAILAGAAALYYMYKKNQKQRAQNPNSAPQYYLSKNGRVYYRDSSGRAHWVTPPPQGIQIPAEEAYEYRQFQGYNNRRDGRDLVGMGTY